MSLREEVEELKKMVAKLAEEVEALKRSKPGGVEKAEVREKAKRPDYVQLIFKVLEDVMGSKQDAGIVFVGGIERKGGRIVDSFFSGVELEDVLKVRPSRVVRVVSPLTNENRAKILLSLLEGPKTASELSREIGLGGGPLYHHLRELMLAGYVESPERGRYVLTSSGCIVTRVVAALASVPGVTPPQVEELPERTGEAPQSNTSKSGLSK